MPKAITLTVIERIQYVQTFTEFETEDEAIAAFTTNPETEGWDERGLGVELVGVYSEPLEYRTDKKISRMMCRALRTDMRGWVRSGRPIFEVWDAALHLARSDGSWNPPESRPGYRVHQEVLGLEALFQYIEQLANA